MGEAAKILDLTQERYDSYEWEEQAREDIPSSEPLVEVRYSEIFDSDIIDEGEEGPWCVDTGHGIDCMSTLSIWMSLAAGTIAPSTKVWRDGRPFWMPIAEVEELTDPVDEETLARELAESYPEISQVIVKRASRHAPAPATAPTKGRWRPSWTRWHSLGMALGIALGAATAAIVWHIQRPAPPAVAGRVAIDIADQAHIAADRALQKWQQPEPAAP